MTEATDDAVAPPVVASRWLHACMLASSFVRLGTLVAIAIAVTGCGAHARPPVGVTVIVDGAAADGVRTALTRGRVDGLALRPIAPPAAPIEPPDPALAAVSAARTAYFAADPSFDKCKAALEPIEVAALLGTGKRELAARVLVWRAACAWGSLDKAGAGVVADQLASFGLDPMPDVGVVTPDVESLIDKALDRAGKTKRVPVTVDAAPGARVLVDGRLVGCNAPCTTDAVPGDHVVSALGDGFAPAWRVERVGGTAAKTTVTLAATPASPDQAAGQWRDRIARGLPPADDTGAKLAARAAGDDRVAYVAAGTAKKLSGVFVVDGAVKARVARSDGNAVALVRDLAIRGKVLPAPPLWRQPKFWIASVLIAGLATGITIAIVYQPETRTSVGPPR